MAVAETFAEAARKAANGNWRKPRAKIYDYNQEFGGNYYQPMIQYVVERENYGPFHERRPVEMPERAEINSNKYTQMRHEDYRNTDMELEHFLTRAYKSQIKDINSSTAMARVRMIHAAASKRRQPHSPLDNVDTPYDSMTLLRGAPPGRERVNHYATELSIIKKHQDDYNRKMRKHLSDVNTFGDYDYHYKFYNGATDKNYQFYRPDIISDTIAKI